MPSPAQYYNVLWSKLKPSVDIQKMGSMNIPLRGSTMFGPQIRHSNWSEFSHKQNVHIADQLRQMNQ